MSDSIIIPSYTNYSYTDSVVPSSIFTSYSLPRHDAAPAFDDEADYPLNYEASPVHDTAANHHDTASFPSSLLTSADVDNNTETIYDSHIEATVTESELVENRQSSNDHHAAVGARETSTMAYRNMKMKYLRSAGIAIPHGVANAAAAARRLSSSPSYEDADVEDTRARTAPASPLSISSSSSSSSSPAVSPVPKSGSMGLLARLLSERAASAPGTPSTLSPSSSSSSLVSMSPSPTHAAAVSAAAPVSASGYVRRTSPISIPKRVSPRGEDTDGVRYRRARQPTRDELDDEERDRQRYAEDFDDISDIKSRALVDGEFTFADVFAAPLASSSRPIAMKKQPAPAVPRRVAVIAPSYAPSMGMSHALPSSLLDGFLAL